MYHRNFLDREFGGICLDVGQQLGDVEYEDSVREHLVVRVDLTWNEFSVEF